MQFSHSVVSNSLWPHELQHTRPPCPSPTPGVHSNWCPSSRWCHPAISNSVAPFSSCPQCLPASQSFPMSQLFAWGGQRIGVSALALVLPMNTHGWSPSEWTGWISLQSLVLVNYTTQFKLCTRDYTTAMYPAWGQFLLPENLLVNSVILKCKLWEWV